jgi:hypothetical protein
MQQFLRLTQALYLIIYVPDTWSRSPIQFGHLFMDWQRLFRIMWIRVLAMTQFTALWIGRRDFWLRSSRLPHSTPLFFVIVWGLFIGIPRRYDVFKEMEEADYFVDITTSLLWCINLRNCFILQIFWMWCLFSIQQKQKKLLIWSSWATSHVLHLFQRCADRIDLVVGSTSKRTDYFEPPFSWHFQYNLRLFLTIIYENCSNAGNGMRHIF